MWPPDSHQTSSPRPSTASSGKVVLKNAAFLYLFRFVPLYVAQCLWIWALSTFDCVVSFFTWPPLFLASTIMSSQPFRLLDCCRLTYTFRVSFPQNGSSMAWPGLSHQLHQNQGWKQVHPQPALPCLEAKTFTHCAHQEEGLPKLCLPPSCSLFQIWVGPYCRRTLPRPTNYGNCSSTGASWPVVLPIVDYSMVQTKSIFGRCSCIDVSASHSG